MFDPKAISEYALSHMDSTHEDVQSSLNLFRTFKRLYEKNPTLLKELLSLAAVESPLSAKPSAFSYVLGIVTDKQSLLITNLSEDRSQVFLQPHHRNQVWSIGRDPSRVSLFVHDKRLSRCHAAIRYHAVHGFLLYDLDSTNGTYVNGIRVRQSYLLKDGDLIRLGSLNFVFFTGSEFCRADLPKPEILRQLSEPSPEVTAARRLPHNATPEPAAKVFDPALESLEKTLHFMHQVEQVQGSGARALNTELR